MDKRTLPGAIPAEKLQRVKTDLSVHDLKFETKAIGYFKDAWMRFKKNKASVTATIIILLIFFLALLTPFISNHSMSDVDGLYAKARPKLSIFADAGFWDGGMKQTINDNNYIHLVAIGMSAESLDGTAVSWETGLESFYNPLLDVGEPYVNADEKTLRNVRVDTYFTPGFQYITLNTMEQFDAIRAWEEENGLTVIYPMIDTRSKYISQFNINDANYWYRHADNLSPLDENNKKMSVGDVIERGLVDNYLRNGDGEIMYYRVLDMSMINIRVLYYNYYQYINGKEPNHILGADSIGYDIATRMASGTLLSLGLSVSVFIINFTIGAILGAIQGYYGRGIDLFLQRVTEIISNFPFMILYMLISVHLVVTGKLSPFWGLILAFVIAGWIGTSRLVRMQFYRFKNQEYILAARTLGAKDSRLMFRHIFPNAMGTIITSSVLSIPFVIFQESTLSYLGIVSFDSKTTTSLGTLLANGRGTLSSDPHIILFPSIIISLLMISFNLFGNGLRDAFNPTLRGTE